jgi:hypothetical protein
LLYKFNLYRYDLDVCYGSDLLGSMHSWQAHGIKLHMRWGPCAS